MPLDYGLCLPGVPVEKTGPDFHRLAANARMKSAIRSIPKHGSGMWWLYGLALVRNVRPSAATCTAVGSVRTDRLLPGPNHSKGMVTPQGSTGIDEVTG